MSNRRKPTEDDKPVVVHHGVACRLGHRSPGIDAFMAKYRTHLVKIRMFGGKTFTYV